MKEYDARRLKRYYNRAGEHWRRLLFRQGAFIFRHVQSALAK